MEKVVILVFLTIYMCQSARILGIIPTPSYSHQVVFQPLWKELSLRGHQVTVITTNPINDSTLTNLTEIDTSFSYKILTDSLLEIINNTQNTLKYIDLSVKVFVKVFDKQLEHPQVKNLINDPSVKFDLIILEYILSAPIAFSKKFNCPYIGIISGDPISLLHRVAGNTVHPIAYPDVLLGEENNLSLIQRIVAVLFDITFDLYDQWISVPYQEDLIQKHFGERYNLKELRRKLSLFFINSNPIFRIARPLNPIVIPIGGKIMRLPSKPLPKDIQDILDNAKEGFIYFSLGSNVNSKDIPEKTKNVILETFKELPYTILWKYELDSLSDKSNNVIISKWLPQLEVLNHVNIKLFITHGGSQSVEEGISARVPMLGMPFFTDQPFNVIKIVNRGFGLSVDYKTLEKEHFKATILEMINNPIYRKRIQELADLGEDQPTTGLELAVWWTEYVIRHNGTQYLGCSIVDLPWYQYYLLDVYGVIISILLFLIYICIVAIRSICKILKYFTKRNVKVKNQ